MHQHGLGAVAAQRDAGAGTSDEGAAVDGVLPGRAGLQPRDIDGADLGDAVAGKAAVGRKREGRSGRAGIEGEGQRRIRRNVARDIGLVAMVNLEDVSAFWIYRNDTTIGKVLAVK